MKPADYPSVANFANDTQRDMHLYLEMVPEEIVLSPGHRISLHARPSPDLLPLTISLVDEGAQVHPYKEFDPDWHVRFRGKLLKAGCPTRLADHE
jgi:hypothetical protein